MKTQLPLEEKHDLVKSGLNENLQKKHALELRISEQFEELKRLEISLEKCARATTTVE
jgi:stress-induced morphogen